MVPSSSTAPRKRALSDGSDAYDSGRKKSRNVDDSPDPARAPGMAIASSSNDVRVIAQQTWNRSVSQSVGYK